MKEVTDGFTSPGVTMQDLIDCFTVDGKCVCSVLPHYGIGQDSNSPNQYWLGELLSQEVLA